MIVIMTIRILLIMLCFGIWTVPVTADQTSGRLDGLFDRLQSASDHAQASKIEHQIWTIWGLPQDRAASVPFAQGVIAMKHGDLDGARKYFDDVVRIAPQFAEGWNKRATVAYALGDLDASVLDIQKTVTLEPRHFGAMAGLALIQTEYGLHESALDILNKIKEIYPHMPGIDDWMQTMREQIANKKT